MTSKLDVALLDLNHVTTGLHTRTMPLGIGLIGSYLLANIPNGSAGVGLYKFADELDEDSRQVEFDVVGVSMYCWNSGLNLHYAKKIKASNPSAIVVCGGPNIGTDKAWIIEFLRKNPVVDFLVPFDGERAFTEVVKRILSTDIRQEDTVAGTFTLTKDGTQLLYGGDDDPKLMKVASLDEIPSPYLNGMMDKFFSHKEELSPFIETNRGCPYQCTFCHTALGYYNKLQYSGLERVKAEISFFAERLKGRPNLPLYLADNNFGMFERDAEITEFIGQMQSKYGWPMTIDTTVGKSQVKKVAKALKNLAPRTLQVNAVVQTTTPSVLKTIRRRNLSLTDLDWIKHQTKNQGNRTSSDLIIGLPGETKDTFFQSIAEVIRAGVNGLSPYTLMNLLGTPLYRPPDDREGYDIRHRIVPIQFGFYDDEPIFETEEVVVATPTLSFDDYLECRRLSYFVQVIHNNEIFENIRRILRVTEIDLFEFIIEVMAAVNELEEGEIFDQARAFMEDTKSELWDSFEGVHEFFRDLENYKALLEGGFGQNLMDKYMRLAQCDGINGWLSVVMTVLRKKIHTKHINVPSDIDINDLLIDLERYLLSTRSIRDYLYEGKVVEDFFLTIQHDFDTWQEQEWPARYLNKKELKYTFSEKSRKIFERVINSENKRHAAHRLFRREIVNHCYPVLAGGQ